MMNNFLRRLCGAFGPSGCEDAVSEEIRRVGESFGFPSKTDRTGNVIFEIEPKTVTAATKTVMISAHMDEVGFMINEIDEEGYLHFSLLGDIDPRVLCGRNVESGNEKTRVMGVIASKAIHHQTAEERAKITEVDDMYIDIGAENREDAEKRVSIGDFGTFFHPCLGVFSENGRYYGGKALDNRAGCAAMLSVMRRLWEGELSSPHRLCFCFTVRGEAGPSGAGLAADLVRPDVAIVVDAAVAADLPGVSETLKISALGDGCVLSYADEKTLYTQGLVNAAKKLADERGIAVQIKGKTLGGKDASEIQRRRAGVEILSLCTPVRYARTEFSVLCLRDLEQTEALLGALVTSPLEKM
jgi:endoglucanase